MSEWIEITPEFRRKLQKLFKQLHSSQDKQQKLIEKFLDKEKELN